MGDDATTGAARGDASSPLRRLGLLALLVALPYLSCLGHGFVYDDELFVGHNPAVASVEAALRAFGQRYWHDGSGLDFYRPLTVLTLAVDRRIGGGAAWVFHGTNLLLHLSSVLLFFTLLRRLGRRAETAFAATALFALWPSGVECVAWVSGRGDLLVVLFGLGAAHALLAKERPSGGSIALASLAVLAAGLSKESAVALPPVLAVLLWARTKHAEGGRRAIALFCLGQGAVLLLLVLLRHQVLGVVLSRSPDRASVNLLLEIPRFLVHAPLLLLNVASGLRPRWPLPAFSPWGELLGLALVVVLPLGLAWRRRHTAPLPLALLVLFWLSLAPCLLQLPAGYGLARRYLYGPSLFLSLLLAEGLGRLSARHGAFMLGFVLLVLLSVTSREAALFADSETLWRAEEQRNPDWRVPPFNLGNALRARNALPEAAAAYRRAVALDPRRAEILVNLGAVLNRLEHFDEARDVLRRATALDPNAVRAWNNLGNALVASGDAARALEAFRRGARLAPSSGVPRYNMARALHALGRRDEARKALQDAVTLQPGLTETVAGLRRAWKDERN